MSPTPVTKAHSGTAVAAVILAAMASGVVYRYWPSEERSIRRHLSNLAETLSLPYADTEVMTITRFAAMREYFHPDVRIRVDETEILTRDVLIRLLSQWTPPPGGVVVELSEMKISLGDDRRIASVDVVASASAKEPGRERTVDARAFTIAMTKASGDWVITAAEGRPPD